MVAARMSAARGSKGDLSIHLDYLNQIQDYQYGFWKHSGLVKVVGVVNFLGQTWGRQHNSEIMQQQQ